MSLLVQGKTVKHPAEQLNQLINVTPHARRLGEARRQIISYNTQCDTPQKLKKLVSDYLKSKKLNSDKDEDWVLSILNDEKKFKKALPKDIRFLIYHVKD